jgi:hypothetical protein
MAKRVQFRRGTTAQHTTFVGAPGEITVDTDKKTVVVHDGITPGGFPATRLDSVGGTSTFNGPIIVTDTTASSSTATGAVRITGGLGVGGRITTTQLVETSSIALKENINPIADALSSILNLSGVTYDRKDQSSINEPGLIAEEVNKILPNLVVKDDEGNPYGIQYTKLVAYLIEAIKDQQQQINELKKKV